MKIHEFQAKDLFRNFGIPVPSGTLAITASQAVENAKNIPGPPWVVKAQIHAGGRGKGGGVRLVGSLEEMSKAADEILSNPLICDDIQPGRWNGD